MQHSSWHFKHTRSFPGIIYSGFRSFCEIPPGSECGGLLVHVGSSVPSPPLCPAQLSAPSPPQAAVGASQFQNAGVESSTEAR